MRLALTFVLVLMLDSAAAEDLQPVTIKTFSDIALRQTQQASARVESLDNVVLSAEVGARVLAIGVRAGQRVAAGHTLVELDASQFELQRSGAQARLELAHAGLDLARLRAERARKLAPERFVSDDQLLEAETRLRQASAEVSVAEVELAQAELLLDRTVVRAPFSGVLQARLIGLGALASPGVPLVELVSTEVLEVRADLPADLAEGLAQAVGIDLAAGAVRRKVQLARLSPLITPGSRLRTAWLHFTDEPLPPGSEGRIEWQDPRPVLPADWIVRRGGELGVLTVDSPADAQQAVTAEWLPLPQADAGRPLRIALDPELRLIDRGRQRVQPGAPLRIEQATP